MHQFGQCQILLRCKAARERAQVLRKGPRSCIRPIHKGMNGIVPTQGREDEITLIETPVGKVSWSKHPGMSSAEIARRE